MSRTSNRSEKIETTLGDLIAALTDVALQSGKSENEGYELASMALEDILFRAQSQIPAVH